MRECLDQQSMIQRLLFDQDIRRELKKNLLAQKEKLMLILTILELGNKDFLKKLSIFEFHKNHHPSKLHHQKVKFQKKELERKQTHLLDKILKSESERWNKNPKILQKLNKFKITKRSLLRSLLCKYSTNFMNKITLYFEKKKRSYKINWKQKRKRWVRSLKLGVLENRKKLKNQEISLQHL